MKITLRLASLSLLTILAAVQAPTALAEPRWQGDWHDGHHGDWGHRDDWRWHGGWRGDGWRGDGWHGGFHPRDIERWHGGYWHHGYYGGRLGWWWVVGGAWYFYTQPVYPYPDPYIPAVPVAPAAPPPPAGSWYYCGANGQYYPYTPSCPVPWTPVVPR
ncbi:hypothetical protein OL229_15640 [Neisseriaceae bacterium JH1-16]|nr:hypothetical protein [Neisseriaceae bacterium JH1-16]